MPIGFIDSGVGGFSILAHLEKNFPTEQFVYLSDTLHFPYSEKSIEELHTIGKENVEILLQYNCNPIVIACNTLTVTALSYLREIFPDTTFIGTVPAVKQASETLPLGAEVVVIATKNTAESEYLQNLVEPFSARTHFTLLGSTPLVTAIENWNLEAITKEIETLFAPVQQKTTVDGVVLGCTHFAFVEQEIDNYLQNLVAFFDPSAGIQKQLTLKLESIPLVHDEKLPHLTFTATNNTSEEVLLQKYQFLKCRLLF